MEINHSTGSILGLMSVDTTIAPQGTGIAANIFTIKGTGGLVLPQGATSVQPAHAAGTLRYNTDTSYLEFDNGTAWTTIRKSHVTVATGTGLTVAVDGTTFGTSKQLLDDGTFTIQLGTELQALSALAGTGLIARTGTNTYAEVTITGTTGNITVTNGSGNGAPTINLATAGTAVTAYFAKFTTDEFGRVTATTAVVASDIIASLAYTPANKAGDTLTGPLVLSADPVSGLQAATKNYVDRIASGSATWRNPVVDPNLIDVVATEPVSPVAETSYIVSAAGTWTGTFVVAVNDVVAWNQGATAWVKVTTLAAGQRFIVAAEYGSVGTALSTAGFANGDLIQYVSGSPSLAGSWSEPEGRSGLAGTGTEILQGTTVLVSYDNSPHFGHSYLYNTDTNAWLEIAGPGTISLGTGLAYVGNTINLQTVTVAKGGTNLTATGSANQILGVVGAGGALEYKTITGTNGIIITNTANGINIDSAGGSVTSVAASTSSTGLSISGSPITSSGTLVFTLNAELQALAALAGTGLVARTAANTYSEVTIAGTAGNITVANGNAIGGAPTLDLAPVTQGTTGTSLVKVALDGFGRVTNNAAVTAADIRALSPYTNGNGLTLTVDTFALATIGTAVTDSFVKVTTDATGRVTATSAVTADDIRTIAAYSAGTGLSLTTGVLAITTVPVANGGTGLTAAGAAQTVLGVKADGTLGYKAFAVTGSGITATVTDGNITLANTGVTSVVAGTGISVSGATGAVTINNTGVTSVTVTGGAGLSINGGASDSVTTTGTIAIALSTALQSLNSISTGGIISFASGSFVSRAIAGTSDRIVVNDGVGATGMSIDLATVGTAVSAASFIKVSTDAYGRVIATSAVTTSDVTALVDASYVHLAGSTMATNANITFDGGELLGLPVTPTTAGSAVSKAYVDSIASGLDPKQSVQVATTANITGYSAVGGTAGTGGFATAPTTVDGVTLATAGQRILVKNQTDAKQNGIYHVVSSTVWERAPDQDGTPLSDVSAGNFTFVESGTANATSGWVLSGTGTVTLNTGALNWVQFSGASTYLGGNGIVITGNSIALSAPVTTTNGGTGLDTIGSADQVLGTNAAGTALEYKTVTAGTAISVTNTAGILTIANTGVAAVAVGTGMAVTAATGSVTVSLNAELQALSALAGTGFVVRTGANTYAELAIASANGTITVSGTNGNSLDLTTVTQASSGDFVKVSVDTYGRIVGNTNVTATDIRTLTPYTAGTGLSLTTGVFAITTVAVANGGTGLTATGTANQVLGTNAAGTALEYKTVTAGTGIEVTNTAGVLTVANTGVTSVGLSVPSILTAGSAVTTTGNLTIALATQAANVIFAGPTSGVNATPTFRALSVDDLPIKLYKENISSPVANTVSGTNSVAIGSGATATANNAVAIGTGAVARNVGAKVFANGSFATAGDAQSGLYVLRNVTTNATTTELFLDGSAAQLVIPTNSAVTYQVMIVGRRTDGTGEVAAYRIEGVIFKDATNASISTVGSPSRTILGEVDFDWDAVVSTDTTSGAIKITVTGEADKNIRWVATVITSEVTN